MRAGRKINCREEHLVRSTRQKVFVAKDVISVLRSIIFGNTGSWIRCLWRVIYLDRM